MTEASDDLPRQTSTVERAVTVLLMLGLAVLVPIATFFGLFLGMVSDGCGEGTCTTIQVTAGVLISSGSPWVVYLGTLAVVILRWVRRKTTWWVPVAALVAGAAIWFVGANIAVLGTART